MISSLSDGAYVLGQVRPWRAMHLQLGSLDFPSLMARVRAGAEARSLPSARLFDNLYFMAKSTLKDNRKIKRGRPATGTAPMVGVRMPKELQAEILAWAKTQPEPPKLATAVRRLVELGLRTRGK